MSDTETEAEAVARRIVEEVAARAASSGVTSPDGSWVDVRSAGSKSSGGSPQANDDESHDPGKGQRARGSDGDGDAGGRDRRRRARRVDLTRASIVRRVAPPRARRPPPTRGRLRRRRARRLRRARRGVAGTRRPPRASHHARPRGGVRRVLHRRRYPRSRRARRRDRRRRRRRRWRGLERLTRAEGSARLEPPRRVRRAVRLVPPSWPRRRRRALALLRLRRALQAMSGGQVCACAYARVCVREPLSEAPTEPVNTKRKATKQQRESRRRSIGVNSALIGVSILTRPPPPPSLITSPRGPLRTGQSPSPPCCRLLGPRSRSRS